MKKKRGKKGPLKKGQVAMEFLMTYGWAIIIILISLATLGYLGIFKGTVPNNCKAD